MTALRPAAKIEHMFALIDDQTPQAARGDRRPHGSPTPFTVPATDPAPLPDGASVVPIGTDPSAGLDAAVVAWQASLFGLDEPAVDPSFLGIERIWLDDECWIDHLPRWVNGADHVFAELVARVPWRSRRVPMYGRIVDEPRLSWWWSEGTGIAPPLELLEQIRGALSLRYEVPLASIGCNLYRTGADSVAWHGDRMAAGPSEPLVAIVSVGAPRPFLLRPLGGGASLSFLLGQGDLLVMGGACQERWQHSVPKVAAAGPRISVTYRERPDPRYTTEPWTSVDRSLTGRHPAGARRAGSSQKGHGVRA